MKSVLLYLAIVLVLGACRRGMYMQPRYEAFEKNEFFADDSAMRPLPPGVIPAGEAPNPQWRTGADGDALLATAPIEIDEALLARGRERFDIFCAVCHGPTGQGDGMIVQRGFPQPPSFHSERLRDAPIGYFVNVANNGYGVMYSYASRVPPDDRWAIAAYIRALQLSRNATLEDVPFNRRAELEGGP